MQTVTIHDAKTHLSKYISEAKKGKKVFIGGFGKPEVMLVKITQADLAKSKTRDFSVAREKVKETPDSFSEETDNLLEKLLSTSLE